MILASLMEHPEQIETPSVSKAPALSPTPHFMSFTSLLIAITRIEILAKCGGGKHLEVLRRTESEGER